MEIEWSQITRYRIPKSLRNKQAEKNKELSHQLSSLTLKIIKSSWTNQEGTIKIRYLSFSCPLKILSNSWRTQNKKYTNPKPSKIKPRSLEQMQTSTKFIRSRKKWQKSLLKRFHQVKRRNRGVEKEIQKNDICSWTTSIRNQK